MRHINVEVVFALPDKLYHYKLTVTPGTTVTEAIQQSKLLTECPDLSLQNMPVGIFGKKISRPAEYVVEEGDRIEIYRPVYADPKVVRKNRVAGVGKSRR